SSARACDLHGISCNLPSRRKTRRFIMCGKAMPYEESVLQKHREVMTRGDEVAVSFTAHEGEKSPGTVRLLRLTSEERSKRGRRRLFTCVAIAPLAFVCPPHIPWPIVTVLVGIVGMRLRRGRAELVAGGEGKCPSCGAFQILEAGNAEWPIGHYCTECRR